MHNECNVSAIEEKKVLNYFKRRTTCFKIKMISACSGCSIWNGFGQYRLHNKIKGYWDFVYIWPQLGKVKISYKILSPNKTIIRSPRKLAVYILQTGFVNIQKVCFIIHNLWKKNRRGHRWWSLRNPR